MRQVVDLEKELIEAGVLSGTRTKRQTIAKTLQLVARAHGVGVGVLKGPRKDKYASRARMDAYAALSYLQLSSTEIGRFLGNRDHSTVLAMLKKRNAEIAAGRPLAWKEIRT